MKDLASKAPNFSGAMTRLFFLLLTTFLVLQSQNNFISHSELWAIASGRLLGEFSSEAYIIYVKPLFYSILKLPFFLPLDSLAHILCARLLFAFVAWLIFYLWYRVALLISRSRLTAILFVIFLMSFHLIFYNIFRVRADILASCFAVALVLKSLQMQNKPLLWKDDWIQVFILSMLVFLSTPKALLFIPILGLFTYFCAQKTQSKVNAKLAAFLSFSLPFFFTCLITLILTPLVGTDYDPYANALVYFQNSFGLLSQKASWDALITSLKINFAQYLFLIVSVSFTFLAIKDNEYKAPVLNLAFLSGLLCILFPEKWEYFLAAFMPFVCLPVVFLIDVLKDKKWAIVLMVSMIIVPLHMASYHHWHVSNHKQLEYIAGFDHLMKKFEKEEYFDSTGLLPKSHSVLMYVGPRDIKGQFESLNAVKERKPAIIIMSEKVSHAEKIFSGLLQSSYRKMFPNLWLRNDLEIQSELQKSDELKILNRVDPRSLFIYDLRPKIRYFDY